MKIKTSELSGRALRYAVACAEGMSFPHRRHCKWPDDHPWVMYADGSIRSAVDDSGNDMNRHYDYTYWMPDEDWAQGGPIIERERVTIVWTPKSAHWTAYDMATTSVDYESRKQDGPTPLIAAMRCYVASKLGEVIDVPEELL